MNKGIKVLERTKRLITTEGRMSRGMLRNVPRKGMTDIIESWTVERVTSVKFTRNERVASRTGCNSEVAVSTKLANTGCG